jgi:hypothetical protein
VRPPFEERSREVAVTVVLSEIQRDTLARLCDTFAPSLRRDDDPTGFWARAASDLGRSRASSTRS